MEALLKNLASTAELLAAAAHCSVAQWDELTLSRAFQWARYCERIFSRFHSNPAIRRIMEKQLQLTHQSLLAAFPGCAEVSFSDLSRCQHLLLVGLLNNPELPSSVAKMLFDTPEAPQQSPRDVTGLCSRIVQYKSACRVLSPLGDGSGTGADAEVQGSMLMEKLGALLSRGGEVGRAEDLLDSVLQECEGAAGQFCLVIAAALLTAENSSAQDLLLGWLQKKHHVLWCMCSTLPAALLKNLSKAHLKFREAYCSTLRKWAADMEYSLSHGEWIQTGEDQTMTFQRLTEHYLVLFEACPSLREDVEKELNALKVSDGDFDVRGLSVWGDLLSAINK